MSLANFLMIMMCCWWQILHVLNLMQVSVIAQYLTSPRLPPVILKILLLSNAIV